MNNEPERASIEAAPQETAALLQRILDAVEHKGHKRWVEITCAVLLSLAAVASAWCAYQATRWGGVQTFRLAAANKAERMTMEHQIAAVQYRSFDASMLITYVQAKVTGDHELEDLLFQRFRPEMKKAVVVWLRTDPFNNPAAPLTPFQMPEYVQAEQQAVTNQSRAAEEQHASAYSANSTSDSYVLLTVLFAIVLFFGGISGTFRSPRLQQAAAGVALLLFVVTVTFLATMPICRE
ncbi:MAG TPA: hypothetical protein VNT26_01015 [Candidatus Sulfotelmatobacter sp.]|nr:hypothetical protein [Candidatus Sulfotelmatobacter sp.]